MILNVMLLCIGVSVELLVLPSIATPSILVQPQNTYINLTEGHSGARVQWMNCYIGDMKSGQVVSWKKDGIVISYDTDMSTSADNIDISRYSIIHDVSAQFSLQITYITESTAVFDSGQYQCVVTFNNNEVIRSDLAHLHVYVEPQIRIPTCHTSIESGVEVPEGDSVIFTCTSKSTGSPQVVHTWFRGTEFGIFPLMTSTTSVIIDNLTTTYSWTAVQAEKGAVFICLATNTHWNSGYTCPFVILLKPDVVVMPTQLTLTSQNYATFTCIASGDPEPYNYVWKYDDVIVETGEDFVLNLDNTTLVIKYLNINDNGNHIITCEVYNSNGVGSNTAKLYISFPIPVTEAIHTTPFVSTSTTKISTVQSPTPEMTFSVTSQSVLKTDMMIIASSVGGVVGIIILILLVVFVIVCVMKFRQKDSRVQEPQQRLENDYEGTEMYGRDEINTDAGQVNGVDVIEHGYDDVTDEINVNLQLAINLRRTDATPKYTYRGSGFESYNKGVQNEDYTTSGCRDDVSYEVVKKQPKMPASIENVREHQNMDTVKDDNQEAEQEHVYAQVNKKKKIPPTLPSTGRVDGNKVPYLDDINHIKENIKPTIKPKPSRPTTRCVDTVRDTDIKTTECDVTHLTTEKVTDEFHGYDIVNIPVKEISRDQQHAANVNSTADDNSVLYVDVKSLPSDLHQTVNNADNDSRHSNVEGLTYADIDFNDTMEVKGTLNRESEETMYAEVKLNNT